MNKAEVESLEWWFWSRTPQEQVQAPNACVTWASSLTSWLLHSLLVKSSWWTNPLDKQCLILEVIAISFVMEIGKIVEKRSDSKDEV